MPRASIVSSSIQALAAKRRWSESDARRVIEVGERSSWSWARYAEELGIDVERLYRWRRRVATSPLAATEFLPIVAVEGASAAGDGIEVVLESGRRVRIDAAVPTELAAAVLRVVMC